MSTVDQLFISLDHAESAADWCLNQWLSDVADDWAIEKLTELRDEDPDVFAVLDTLMVTACGEPLLPDEVSEPIPGSDGGGSTVNRVTVPAATNEGEAP